jgi:dual specificity protein phosphatase-like protein
MLHVFRFAKNGILGFRSRLKTQGWRSALIWLFGHGIPKLTGVPVAKYSQITPQIYVGAQVNKLGKQKLAFWGINGSVNMRIEYDDAAHDVAFTHHCYLPTDDGHAPTLTQLQTGIAFIRQRVTAGNKVYIHCRSGIGRAPTMAAAYFMSQGYTLSEAVNLIEKARPFIRLTSRQIDQLHQFAAGQKTA